MNVNHIIFSDLSTYSPKETIPFYENVFGWSFINEYDYYTAFIEDKAIIGLYETPEKFKLMKMPHFWMTYIKVKNVKLIVDKAHLLGGIVEIEQTLEGFGKVALIRDPSGAGFTIYEGNYLQNTRTENQVSTLIWNELHVSNALKVIPFYENLFNWEFQNIENGIYNIYYENIHLANLLEIPNVYKGKYEYWISSFGVKDLHKTKRYNN